MLRIVVDGVKKVKPCTQFQFCVVYNYILALIEFYPQGKPLPDELNDDAVEKALLGFDLATYCHVVDADAPFVPENIEEMAAEFLQDHPHAIIDIPKPHEKLYAASRAVQIAYIRKRFDGAVAASFKDDTKSDPELRRRWISTMNMVHFEVERYMKDPELFGTPRLNRFWSLRFRSGVNRLRAIMRADAPTHKRLRELLDKDFTLLKLKKELHDQAMEEIAAARPDVDAEAYVRDPWGQFLVDGHPAMAFDWPPLLRSDTSEHMIPPGLTHLLHEWNERLEDIQKDINIVSIDDAAKQTY